VSRTTKARAAVAALTRHRPDDLEIITQARATLSEAVEADRLDSHIAKLVDAAPSLSSEQRDRLATLLRSST
jgi:hypothetical protein